MKRKLPGKIKRIVVKVGSAILTTEGLGINKAWVKSLVAQIAALVKKSNLEVILVTSGAISAGMGVLGLCARPKLLPPQQAAAAIGQGQLMKIYDSLFRAQKLLTAQILLTRDDLSSRKRYLNAKNTLLTLLNYKTVPIINENDTVSVDEIKFGDNDKLSVLVANLVQAQLLIILSDVDGLYAKGTLVSVVEKIDSQIERLAEGTKSRLGTGGMISKLEAAKICCASGITCIVANGRTPDILLRLIKHEELGTLFLPNKQLVAKKSWIGYSAKISGQIVVDAGAKQALVARKKSLLCKGIAKVHGNFASGDTLSILDTEHREFARGLTNYSSSELDKIKGQSSDQIKAILGFKYYDEVVHRDNLVIL
ncbi:MAG: glutamate 5-kinase [Candidatus Omnitrophica bacterium]|nr:glutamate 5-kinase [Candidatus Omnitrophota bacterium]